MPSKDLKRLSELSSEFAKSQKHVRDVVLFGSAAKGKLNPGDIDIAVLAEASADRVKLTGDLTKLLSSNDIEAHVSVLFFENIFREPLWQSVIREGVSLLSGEALSKSLGYESKTLFQFEPGKLDKSDRVRFQYALAGRDSNSGIIKDLGAEKISGNAIIIPVSSENEAMQFFDRWRVPYKIKRVMAE
jgi:predicted nucleotidyltransferase